MYCVNIFEFIDYSQPTLSFFSFFLMPVLFHIFVMDKLMQPLIANSVTLQ